MSDEFIIGIAVATCASGMVLGAFAMPPLTSSSSPSSSSVNQEAFQQIVQQERAFCRQQGGQIDCRCFANKSSVILADEQDRIQGLYYADQVYLARIQAAQAC